MQEFLLRIRRSVLGEAVVEFDVVGKSWYSLSASRRRFLGMSNTSHCIVLPRVVSRFKGTLYFSRNGNQNWRFYLAFKTVQFHFNFQYFVSNLHGILGSFRLDYEYEIEYECEFTILVFRLHIITTNTHFIPWATLRLYLTPTWRRRALEISLVWNSKVVLVLNLVLVVQSKAP